MGYALNSNGRLQYIMPDVNHGDRYHIAAFSTADNDKEMLGYGVQQRNPSTLLEYIYNASTGKLLWTNYGGDGSIDIGCGDIGDVDPTHEGYECWSFQGMYDKDGNKVSNTNAYPSLKLYWDGDLLSESYNDSLQNQSPDFPITLYTVYPPSAMDILNKKIGGYENE